MYQFEVFPDETGLYSAGADAAANAVDTTIMLIWVIVAIAGALASLWWHLKLNKQFRKRFFRNKNV